MHMCTAEGCDKKETCLRFKGEWNKFKQLIYTHPPFIIHDGKQFCHRYIEFNEKQKNDKCG